MRQIRLWYGGEEGWLVEIKKFFQFDRLHTIPLRWEVWLLLGEEEKNPITHITSAKYHGPNLRAVHLLNFSNLYWSLSWPYFRPNLYNPNTTPWTLHQFGQSFILGLSSCLSDKLVIYYTILLEAFLNDKILVRASQQSRQVINGILTPLPYSEYLWGKYHCTIDLLFDWFGSVCFCK